jgi:hypothetical protein
LYGSCGADKTHVFLRIVAKMSDRFFRETNQDYILCEIRKELIFSEAYEGEAMKKPSACDCHKWFKESSRVEIKHEENAPYFL